MKQFINGQPKSYDVAELGPVLRRYSGGSIDPLTRAQEVEVTGLVWPANPAGGHPEKPRGPVPAWVGPVTKSGYPTVANGWADDIRADAGELLVMVESGSPHSFATYRVYALPKEAEAEMPEEEDEPETCAAVHDRLDDQGVPRRAPCPRCGKDNQRWLSVGEGAPRFDCADAYGAPACAADAGKRSAAEATLRAWAQALIDEAEERKARNHVDGACHCRSDRQTDPHATIPWQIAGWLDGTGQPDVARWEPWLPQSCKEAVRLLVK